MTVGAFELVDSGLLGQQDGSIDVGAGTPFYAILTTHAGGAIDPDLDIDYADISAQECADGDYAPVDVVLTVLETGAGSGIVEVDMPAQADFGSAVSIAARYFVILAGAEGAPGGTDRILGFMDLNDGGAGDVSSVVSDFKVSANANGLYRYSKAP